MAVGADDRDAVCALKADQKNAMKRIAAALLLTCALLAGMAAAAFAKGADDPTPTTTTETATTTAPEPPPPATTTTTTTPVPSPPTPPAINYGVADDNGKYADDGGAWFDGMLAGDLSPETHASTEQRWRARPDTLGLWPRFVP